MSILGKIAGGVGKGQKLQGKLVLAIIAFVLLAKGFGGLQKALQVRMSGNAVTGEVVQHLTECSARIREEGRWQRFEVPCQSVVALRERYGYSNVRSYRTRRVMVRFVRDDGQVHFAKVRPSRKFVRWRTPVGTKVDLVYSPSNPDRIRPQPNWGDVRGDLLFFFGGIVMLVYLFWSIIGPLLIWLSHILSDKGARQPGRRIKSNTESSNESWTSMIDGLVQAASKGNAHSGRTERRPTQAQRSQSAAEQGQRSDNRSQSAEVPSSRGTAKRMYMRPRNWRKRPVGNPGKYEPGSWFGLAR